LRALATEGQLEALKDLDLDMDVRSAKAEICRAKIAVLKREIQLMLEADISSRLKAKSTNSSPPPSPSYSPLPVAPPTSPIYSPLANESPIYSPEPKDQEPEEVEQKDFAPQHAEMEYPPTRSGINPQILQDWPRPIFRRVLDIVSQPTQKQKRCTCDCHQPGPRYNDFYFAEHGAPNLVSEEIKF